MPEEERQNTPTSGTRALVPFHDRVSLRPVEAAAALGISPRKLAEIMADRARHFPRAKVGGVVLIPVDELKAWIATEADREAQG